MSVGSTDDYISLTDITRYKNPHEPKDVVVNWMRLRNTIEYLGIWEQLNNANFRRVDFDAFLHEPVQALLDFLHNDGLMLQIL